MLLLPLLAAVALATVPVRNHRLHYDTHIEDFDNAMMRKCIGLIILTVTDPEVIKSCTAWLRWRYAHTNDIVDLVIAEAYASQFEAQLKDEIKGGSELGYLDCIETPLEDISTENKLKCVFTLKHWADFLESTTSEDWAVALIARARNRVDQLSQ